MSLPTPGEEPAYATAERARVRAAYARRERALPPERYAPWQPAELHARSGRERVAAALLRRAGAFPAAGDACLELGVGRGGWLGTLLAWGLRLEDLHGIELDPHRAAQASAAFAGADVRLGDAGQLPWEDARFRLIIASTLFSSLLDPRVRAGVAREARRTLAPGGALLVYDLARRNPTNPDVRPLARGELQRLFPDLTVAERALTLAPPLARRVAPLSWTLATLLEACPLLRTHRLSVLRAR